MARKPPKSVLGVTPEQELASIRSYNKESKVSARRDVLSTKSEKEKAKSHIEEFVRTDRIRSYPSIETDEKEDAQTVCSGPSSLVVLEALIDGALSRGLRRPALSAHMIATMLLGSYDESGGCVLQKLGGAQLTVARVLAHVASLPVRLEPRVAISIARRATQMLLNRPATTTIPPSSLKPEDGPVPLEEELGVPESEEQTVPDEEVCVECGATYAAGHGHRCAADDRPSVSVGSCVECDKQAPLVEQAGALTSEPDGGPRANGEAAALAVECDAQQAADEKPVAPSGGKTLRHEKVERTVVGYARVRADQKFFFSEGIGKPGYFDFLKAGSMVEVLAPDERDLNDQQYQRQRDVNHKLPPRQLVVVRWWGGISLLWGSDVERVTVEQYRTYTATTEAGHERQIVKV